MELGSPALKADYLPAELPESPIVFFFFLFLNEGYFHFVMHSRKGFKVKKKKKENNLHLFKVKKSI